MILLIYTIFTVIAGSGGDSSDDDETPTIDINALNLQNLPNVKLPRPRPTDIVYVINNGYATFQHLIIITLMKIFNLS